MDCCCQAAGLEEVMDFRTAAKDLKRYRKDGPQGTTKILLDALIPLGVQGLRHLDIGGGAGALQHELLQAGVEQVTSVDASSAYLQAARQEAERQGHAHRIRQHHGDFVDMAHEMKPVEIVTLDRVVCCYDDMPGLIANSTRLASKFYGIVYPKDSRWMRAFTWISNLYFRLRRSQFRVFTHSNAAIEQLIQESGLKRIFSRSTFVWKIRIYQRANT
jgi:magnesium-protoporphyrin O-methyltransferase